MQFRFLLIKILDTKVISEQMKQTQRSGKIKSVIVSKKGKEITGYFKLSDGTKTKFSIDKQGEWEQWGNTTDNLCVSVPNVQRMVSELIFNY